MLYEKIFVSYCWESEDHKNRILSFVDFLRRNGFPADLDQNILQSETSTNFKEMMFKNLESASKVIIILSNGYREKANSFSGGVGTEYRYILDDIDTNPQKYILCTLSSFNNLNLSNILPSGLLGREVISLSDDGRNNYEKLFAKLMGHKAIKLSPVSSNKPVQKEKTILPFESFIEISNNNTTDKKKDVFKVIKRYLIENKQIIMQYGPPSFIASKNPLSDAYKIWNSKKTSTILPNNSKIIDVIENNISLLSWSEQEVFYKFKEHALAFEVNCKERLDSEATIRFPIEFETMINDEVN